MSKMKNPIYAQTALEAGGAHYHEVGGPLLEQYSDLLVKDIVFYLTANATAFDGDMQRGIKNAARLVNERYLGIHK